MGDAEELLDKKKYVRMAARLSRAALLQLYLLDWCLTVRSRHGITKTVQYFVGRVLQTGVGLVQLTCSLRGKLTELIAVLYVSEGSKNEVRAHHLLLIFNPVAAKSVKRSLPRKHKTLISVDSLRSVYRCCLDAKSCERILVLL